MSAQKFGTRKFIVLGETQRKLAIAVIKNCPVGVEVVIRDQVTIRNLSQNGLMWVGPLKDIAEQAWVGGRQFSDVVWHEFFKKEYLPDEFDPELCKEDYRKWDYTPIGDKVLIGSTTQLTVKGFAQYLEQVYAAGADLGVMFRESKERR